MVYRDNFRASFNLSLLPDLESCNYQMSRLIVKVVTNKTLTRNKRRNW